MILLFVGPSSSSLEAPRIASRLSEAGHEIQIILEPRVRRFVGPSAFAGFSELVEKPSEVPQAVLFAPAESGTIARLARGFAGSHVGGCPVFVAPDLDPETAKHPAIRKNIELLKRDGVRIIEGENGAMAGVDEVVAGVLGGLGGMMEGLKVVVTAGGTREPIDSVRFIGNRSSGRMGLAIARQAHRMGAEVSVIAANVATREPGVVWTPVETVEEMRRSVMESIRGADILVMAAAVSDFTPASVVEVKIRRGGNERLTLELASTSDILGSVRDGSEGLFVVGFAATHGDPVPDAREKLRKKGADLIVGNDISRVGIGFESEENEVCVVGRDVEKHIPQASKDEVAREILRALLDEMNDPKKERQD
ncbi:MAG: bifunctional phosphopantothenoylcysteine decarboxylase/phosphopantothenate--cysteine ligase CoaBC [Rubrobacteraceae bacterium]